MGTVLLRSYKVCWCLNAKDKSKEEVTGGMVWNNWLGDITSQAFSCAVTVTVNHSHNVQCTTHNSSTMLVFRIVGLHKTNLFSPTALCWLGYPPTQLACQSSCEGAQWVEGQSTAKRPDPHTVCMVWMCVNGVNFHGSHKTNSHPNSQ